MFIVVYEEWLLVIVHKTTVNSGSTIDVFDDAAFGNNHKAMFGCRKFGGMFL